MTEAGAGELLPEQARFDVDGGAVGSGTFEVNGEGSPFAPPPHRYVALRLHELGGRPTATLHAVPSEPIRGIFESHAFEGARLALPEWAAIWIEEHLRRPRPCKAGVSTEGGPRLIINESSLARISADGALGLASAHLTELLLEIERRGEDSFLTLRGRTGGEASAPAAWKARFGSAPIFEIKVSVLITRANRFLLFGEWPGESGEFPRSSVGLIPRSSAGELNAAAALAGGGAIYGWSGQGVLNLWEHRDKGMRIGHLADRRADGLLKPEGAFYVNLPFREIERVLERVPTEGRDPDGAISGEIALESATGSLGYVINHTGWTSADEGRHEQRVTGLHARFRLDASGLWLSLDIRLSGYVPGTVRGEARGASGGESIDALVPWESLIIARSELVTRRALFLS